MSSNERKEKMRPLSELHPWAAFIYFLSVLLVTMFTQSPILLAVSLLGAVMYACIKKMLGIKTVGFGIVMFLLAAITNPLFSHKGVTPLFYFNNNPVTLEALIYGMYLGCMILSVMLWFACFNKVMSSDKLLYLFGTFSPKISLMLCSALRFIPRFKELSGEIRKAQTALGRYSTDSLPDKLSAEAAVYSALVGRALEGAIDTGSAMRSRGFSLKGRSRFSLFKFTVSDAVFIFVALLLCIFTLYVLLTGKLSFEYYPSIAFSDLNILNILAYTSFALLCFMPFAIEVKEVLLWRYYRSKI